MEYASIALFFAPADIESTIHLNSLTHLIAVGNQLYVRFLITLHKTMADNLKAPGLN